MARYRQETVNLVWDGLLEADRLHRYYGYLTERLEKITLASIILATAFSSGAAVLWIHSTQPSDSVWLPILIGLSACLNLILFVFNQSKSASRSVTIHSRLATMLTEWEDLWADAYTADDDEVRSRWYDLQQRMSLITEGSPSQLPPFADLVERSTKEAYSYRQKLHAATETPSTATTPALS